MYVGFALALLSLALALLHRTVHRRAIRRDGVGVPGVLFLSVSLVIEGIVWIAITATIASSFYRTAEEVMFVSVAMSAMGLRLLFKLGIWLAMTFSDIPPHGIYSWRQALAFSALGYAGALKRATKPWMYPIYLRGMAWCRRLFRKP